MNSDVYTNFKQNVISLLGHLDYLEHYLGLVKQHFENCFGDSPNGDALVLVNDVNTHIFECNGELFGQTSYTLNDLKNNLEIVLSNNCKSLLVTLITILEEYLKDICLWVYNKKPVIYKSDSKKIELTYSEIIEIGTIEDLRMKIIEKTRNNILRDNIADSFKELFIEKFKCNIPNFDTQKDDIKEISEIRNIIIHNNSIID